MTEYLILKEINNFSFKSKNWYIGRYNKCVDLLEKNVLLTELELKVYLNLCWIYIIKLKFLYAFMYVCIFVPKYPEKYCTYSVKTNT